MHTYIHTYTCIPGGIQLALEALETLDDHALLSRRRPEQESWGHREEAGESRKEGASEEVIQSERLSK